MNGRASKKIKSINFPRHPVRYSEVKVNFQTGYDRSEVGPPNTIIDGHKLRRSYIKNAKWQPNDSIHVMLYVPISHIDINRMLELLSSAEYWMWWDFVWNLYVTQFFLSEIIYFLGASGT